MAGFLFTNYFVAPFQDRTDFDLENSYFIGADIQMTMEVSMDSESENDGDFGVFVEMKSNNVFKIRLEAIEE